MLPKSYQRHDVVVLFLSCMLTCLGCPPSTVTAQKVTEKLTKQYRNEIGLNSNYILRSLFNYGPEPVTSPILQYKRDVLKKFRMRFSGGGGYNIELLETFDSPDRTIKSWGYVVRLGLERRFNISPQGAVLLGFDGFHQNLVTRSKQTINPFSPNPDVVNSFDDENRYGFQPYAGAYWRFAPRWGVYFETNYSIYLYKKAVGFTYERKTIPDDIIYRNGTQLGYQPNATVYLFLHF